ncbi:MAG TPA: RNA polymerase sigma factor [Longimicrobiales bacterium]|nr:RNA polymerase sigma factor [Longimicrobiales bacterium]
MAVSTLTVVKSHVERPADSDRELAGRIADTGDERAFRTLYRRHTPALYPFVLRLLGGSEADADDVVQDTWMRAVRGLARFRWDASFRTWLLGIGLNRAREVLRRRARHDGVAPMKRELPTAPVRTEDRMDLERAIAALPEGYRTVLLLHDVEGFTHPEISERLEIAVGTSRSQLFHARRALRGLLEPPGALQETT